MTHASLDNVQETPQPPQLFGSLAVSTQVPPPPASVVVEPSSKSPPPPPASWVPPHNVVPLGHWHALFWHVIPPMQTFPHTPQFALSLVRSVHSVATAGGGGQTVGFEDGHPQAPAVQSPFFRQLLAQSPQ